jgi:hypothetical protein
MHSNKIQSVGQKVQKESYTAVSVRRVIWQELMIKRICLDLGVRRSKNRLG